MRPDRDSQYGFKAGDYVRSKCLATGHVLGWQGRELVVVMIEHAGRSPLTIGLSAVFTPDALTLIQPGDA